MQKQETSGAAASPCKSTPGQGSSSSSRRAYSDRFIPTRRGVNLQDSFALLPDSPPKKRETPQDSVKDDNLDTYAMLLRSELLGSDEQGMSKAERVSPIRPQRNLFRYRTVPPAWDENSRFSVSPVGCDSQRIFSSPRKTPRKIPTVPYKVLDAPALQATSRPSSGLFGLFDPLGLGPPPPPSPCAPTDPVMARCTPPLRSCACTVDPTHVCSAACRQRGGNVDHATAQCEGASIERIEHLACEEERIARVTDACQGKRGVCQARSADSHAKR
eukprot:6177921-Pleurochrysis_carterae.AAC.1